jgi:hypothetical protein
MKLGDTTYLLVLGGLLATSCLSNSAMVPIETRPIGPGGTYEGEALSVVGRSATPTSPAEPLFTKKSELTIQPAPETNVTGSLYRLNDRRNDFYSVGRAAEVNEFLTVEVDSARGDRAPDKTAPASNSEAAAASPGGTDPQLDAMMKSLPDLTPADPQVVPVKRFKMQVVHRYDNGDVLARYQRQSQNGENLNSLSVTARVPYDRMMAGSTLRASDLSDITFIQSNPDESIDRRSAGWEDEYTARLSGFEESKSRYALELEEKRKALAESRLQIQKQIESLISERKTMAKEREDILKERQKDQNRIAELTAVAGAQAAALEVADTGNVKEKIAEGADKVADKADEAAAKVRGKTEEVKKNAGAGDTKPAAAEKKP